jgi:hypothetical protein
MTDFTPAIRVMVLPPNTDHTATKTEITSWVDYNINISRGTSEYINPPYPAQCTLSLLFDDNVIPDIELGSWVEIQIQDSADAWQVLQAGNVTDRSSSYRSYGLLGFVLEWQFAITSTISLLQNNTYYNDEAVDALTYGCIGRIIDESTAFNWFAINQNLTWENYGPGTWADVDTLREVDFPVINYDIDDIGQQLPAGTQNTWADLVTLVYGVFGYIIEKPDGELDVYYASAPLTNELTLTADMLTPDLVGGEKFDTMRNVVTINKYDSTLLTYYESESVSLYGDRTGTLDTYLTTDAEINLIGQKILNSMAYPLLSTEQVSMNLLNPAFSDAERDLLLTDPLGKLITVQSPLPMGGTQEYLTIGLNYSINKDSFILDLTLAPYSMAWPSINWEQVPYNYTWTSYGVTYPTQEWQDL